MEYVEGKEVKYGICRGEGGEGWKM